MRSNCKARLVAGGPRGNPRHRSGLPPVSARLAQHQAKHEKSREHAHQRPKPEGCRPSPSLPARFEKPHREANTPLRRRLRVQLADWRCSIRPTESRPLRSSTPSLQVGRERVLVEAHSMTAELEFTFSTRRGRRMWAISLESSSRPFGYGDPSSPPEVVAVVPDDADEDDGRHPSSDP